MTTIAERFPAVNPIALLVPGAALRRLQETCRALDLAPFSLEFTDGAVWRFGDGAPGYIPTDQCWRDGYNDSYCWVAPMVDGVMIDAMTAALGVRE